MSSDNKLIERTLCLYVFCNIYSLIINLCYLVVHLFLLEGGLTILRGNEICMTTEKWYCRLAKIKLSCVHTFPFSSYVVIDDYFRVHVMPVIDDIFSFSSYVVIDDYFWFHAMPFLTTISIFSYAGYRRHIYIFFLCGYWRLFPFSSYVGLLTTYSDFLPMSFIYNLFPFSSCVGWTKEKSKNKSSAFKLKTTFSIKNSLL